MSEKGIKFDGEKPDFSLIPPFALEELAKLLSFGAKKYAPNNWQKVKPKSRYFAAMARHMNQYLQAVLSNDKAAEYDAESGVHHLTCVACNAMFLMEHSTVYSKDEPFYGEKKEEKKAGLPPIDPSPIDTSKVEELAKEIARRQLETKFFFPWSDRSPNTVPFSPFQPPYTPGDMPTYRAPGEPDYNTIWCGTPIECLTTKQASDIIDLK